MWRILLVEDDEVDRLTVRRALAQGRVDADIAEAADCATAVDLLARAPWDCVLLDFQLPGGDGQEVMTRSRAAGVDVPFVVLTGHGDEALAVELMKLGASDYLPKALLTPARLAQSVRQSIRVAEAERLARTAASVLVAHATQLERLVEAGARVHASTSVHHALGNIATEARRLFGVSACASFAVISAGEAGATSSSSDGVFDDGCGLLLENWVHSGPFGGKRFTSADIASDSVLSAVVERLAKSGIDVHSWLAAPMIEGERCFGSVHVARSEGWFTELDAHLLAGLAHTSSIALENARLHRAAQDATQARDDVLAIVSHDLRSPLNNVALSASLLEEHLSERADGATPERKLVRRIVTGVGRMNRLIEDLLEVSRIEAGTLSVTLRAELAPLLVSEALESAAPLAEAKGCSLVQGVVDQGRRVLADRDRVVQMFSNVLGNAIRFTPRDGTITVTGEVVGDVEWFTISDQGPGIDPAHLPMLFERFWRAPNAARGGAGLGLFIAKGIVEAHGGKIEIDSTLGKGSRVRFCLRLAP